MNILKLVIKNITRRRGRFIFTLLGITIGMAAFVALLSLGGNMRAEVTRQAHAMGASLIVTPKNWCAYDQISILTGNALPESLQLEVYEAVAAIEGITAVPYLTQKTAVQNNPVTVTGILPAEMKEFMSWEVAKGDYFSSVDERAIVLGYGIAERFELDLKDSIRIQGEEFPIKAILAQTGSNDDVSIFLPLAVVQEVFEVEGYISYIAAQVADLSKLEFYEAAIIEVANVSVTSDRQLLSAVLSMLGSVNMTLQLIAGVALIAAAFGIINTMMTAIYERRREIGILRAIGAKGSSIFKIFVLESGLYGLLGGLLGVVLGLAVSALVAPLIAESSFNDLLKGAQIEVSLDPGIIALSIIFALVISVASGLYPAWKASRLTPVEAISYE
ncbi:MAG: ABC transporter permease [Coriobacteriia bacterium]|nr:ABC transporter permease [Coriobacteriia bacterium]